MESENKENHFIEKNKEPLSSMEIIKAALADTHQHFKPLVLNLSFSLLISICVFTPLWALYIKVFGMDHIMVRLFEFVMFFSICVVIMFMASFYLFNRTHPPEQALKLWRFTTDVTWPWLIEGVKAAIIIMAGIIFFFIPGIIKSIHYTFFSFIVFFDKNYKENKISALKHSRELVRGLGWWIFFLFLIPSNLITGIPGVLLSDLYTLTESVWIIYPVLILFAYVISVFYIYLISLSYFIYVIKEKQHKALSSTLVKEP